MATVVSVLSSSSAVARSDGDGERSGGMDRTTGRISGAQGRRASRSNGTVAGSASAARHDDRRRIVRVEERKQTCVECSAPWGRGQGEGCCGKSSQENKKQNCSNA